MPRKSETIAVSRTSALNLLYNGKTLRSIKAFLYPYTQIYWGYQEDFLFAERKTSMLYLNISDFAEAMGYSMSSRITTEIRKIFRKMNEELFGEDEEKYYFTYEGTSKDKTDFILKIHKPKEVYNLAENCSFLTISADDIFRCKSFYDVKVLLMIVCAQDEKTGGFSHKTLKVNTFYLKNLMFNMSMYENCYVNKKHPSYNSETLWAIEEYYNKAICEEITEEELNSELEMCALNHGKSLDDMMREFNDVVSFNKRSRIEDYLQHGLELINQGSMYRVSENKKSGKLFSKIKINGYRVDHYEISVCKI